MTEMSPENESKSNAPPKALVNDEEEGVANATGKDEQPELRKYKWLAAFFMSVALVSISANAGLTIAIVTKTVGTHTQKHVYAVSLTDSAGESAVAKVPCVEVAEAIVSCVETSMAACETHPGLLCDVLPSAATASSAQALSYEDAFGGAIHFLGPRGRGLRAKGAI
jgi:hypothetical protein